jgi:hypothetical protein
LKDLFSPSNNTVANLPATTRHLFNPWLAANEVYGLPLCTAPSPYIVEPNVCDPDYARLLLAVLYSSAVNHQRERGIMALKSNVKLSAEESFDLLLRSIYAIAEALAELKKRDKVLVKAIYKILNGVPAYALHSINFKLEEEEGQEDEADS